MAIRMHRIAIVILNWNTRGFLEKYLPGVIRFSSMEGAKVVVADNGSVDGSVSFIKEYHPSVEIIEFDRNHGFAPGYNMALSRIEAEYFVILNSDVQVSENWLYPLLHTMDSDPLVAVCMPRIRDLNKPEFFEYAGAAGGFIDKYGYAFCQGRIFDIVENDYNQYNKVKEIFWATGACMIVRAQLFKIMGGFDPEFFAHMEEIDLCWRLKNRGYRIVYNPGSIIYHLGGGTLPKENPFKTYLNFRNNLLMLAKNLPPGKTRKIIATRIFMDYLSAIRFLIKGSFGDFRAIFRAHSAFYKGSDLCREFRRKEARFITGYNHNEIYPKSIVFQYFVKRKYTFTALKWF